MKRRGEKRDEETVIKGGWTPKRNSKRVQLPIGSFCSIAIPIVRRLFLFLFEGALSPCSFVPFWVPTWAVAVSIGKQEHVYSTVQRQRTDEQAGAGFLSGNDMIETAFVFVPLFPVLPIDNDVSRRMFKCHCGSES